MTTYNHTAIAITALAMTQHSSTEVKLLTCGGLILSHLVLDAIPHLHWYSFENIRRSSANQMGALVELGGGLLVMPLLFSYFFHFSLWWMMAYVFSASALDFLVAFGVKWVEKINNKAHFWEKQLDLTETFMFEVFQTLFLFCLMLFAIGGSS